MVITNSIKSLRFLVIFIACLMVGPAFGQLNQIDYNVPKEYEIGEVKVEGANYSDENAIINLSGLRVGDRITLPGEKISEAVRKLWKLKLFTNVKIIKSREVGDVVFILIQIEERPRLSKFTYTGVKKMYHDDLDGALEPFLIKGSSVTTNTKQNSINAIKKYFIEKGFLDVSVNVNEKEDNPKLNTISLEFEITRNEKVKIETISFSGNTNVKDKKLRKQMKNTKHKKRLFAKSRLVKKELEEDKAAIITFYNKIGYRDAKIIKDSVWRNEDGYLQLHLDVQEGGQYYFRNITWKGNTIHDDKRLTALLGIQKGDVYNLELLETRLRFSPDGRDVSTLYLDDGYLFFRVDPIEIAISNDSIDIEMRMVEGPKATIDKVVIQGNTITHEHVIRRELWTKPGAKFSRSDLIRSQRQIIGLGYFDPEKLGMNTPVNPERGTVDIEYVVEERPSDQLELSAGWGGFSGVIGTLGFQFNNFSLRNILNKKAWRPLPKGDGQKLSLRAQTNSRFYQSYNFSFSEPWLGGKKPNSFTLGGFYTRFDRTLYSQGVLTIGRGFVGLGSQLKWPDNNFISNTTINIENIQLENYGFGGFRFEGQNVTDGNYNNFSLKQVIARSTVFEPTFPRSGSKISLTMQFTPPYSLFRKNKDYDNLDIQDRFRWLEYHKWRLDAEWYATLVGKLVFKASAKMGLLGFYNRDVGLSPFERFELGGDGLSNQSIGITGRDILALRGYETTDIEPNNEGGGTLFNKFSVELRYPLSLQENSTIFVLGFLDGGNSWIGGENYNPFDLKRSAGIGLRVFLPMFGLLGFDYGFGFDKPGLIATGAKWGEFGKFSIILGFEPD